MKKFCFKCEEFKIFSPHHSSSCHDCYKASRRLKHAALSLKARSSLVEYRKQWQARNQDKIKEYNKASRAYRRAYILLRKYGLTEVEYLSMVNVQEGCCLICKEETNLVIDHCHVTDKVRGLLCQSCNKAIGFFRDDPKHCRAAAEYLQLKSL